MARRDLETMMKPVMHVMPAMTTRLAILLALVVLPALGKAALGAPAGRTGVRPADAANDTANARDGDPPAAPESRGRGDATRDELAHVDDFAHGGAPAAPPAIGAVLSAAYAAAGLDHDPGHGWTRRARIAGLVPWLTVRTARDTSWQDNQSEVGHGTTLELRATWRLDRLLFDGHELQVATIEAARHRERRRLATRVTRAYFTWRRAEAAAAGPGDERTEIRRAETIAELDALTDGWFSDELDGGRHARGRPRDHRATAR